MIQLKAGDRVGGYTILELLGQGGMATVYRARQSAIDREVALKVLAVETGREEFARRFERESKLVSALNHPNIVKVFDYGEHNETIYLAMELLNGGDLFGLIRDSAPLAPERIAGLLTQIATALTYAHGQGVVHRDLKPHNIMLNARGEAVITDFGIAKALHETSTLTQAGMVVGTPPYMPPEQWRGETVDSRSDVYALGAILFEMLTGQMAFHADSALALLHLHIYQPPPSVSRLRPDTPSRVDWIVQKALAKHQDNRFESATALAAAFRAVLQDTPSWGRADAPAAIVAAFSQQATTLASDRTPDRAQRAIENTIPTLVEISPAQAAEQAKRALAALEADSKAGGIHVATRLINPLPLDTRDRFKGRLKELADVMQLITQRAHVISIYGRGGVGKTALACKVLADLGDAANPLAPDGMVALSAITTGISFDRVLADFGKLLGGTSAAAIEAARADSELTAAQKTVTLLDALKEGRYLLLLDNLETLQDPEDGELIDTDLKAFITGVLGGGGALSILITSREPLTVPRELRSQERLVPLDQGLATDDAMALLRGSDPDGLAGLRDAADAKLIRIAEKTRGFPRALEAVVGLLLEDSLIDLDELLNESRDVSLLDSEITPIIVKSAIDRLSATALCVMEGLAVFNLPVKQAAIDYLLAPFVDTSHLRTTFNRLVRAYFVNYNKVTSAFALHPIDRDYCYGRLPPGAVTDNTALDSFPRYTQHALHFRAAQFYQAQRKPSDEWKSIDDLAPQLAEFDHLVAAEDYDAAAQVMADVGNDYLYVWGNYARLITMYHRLENKVKGPRLERHMWLEVGQVYAITGQMTEAISICEKALISAREHHDRSDEGAALNTLGAAQLNTGHVEQAIYYFQLAIPIAHELGLRQRESRLLGNLGVAVSYLGQIERAIQYLEQAVALARESGDRLTEGGHLGNLAAMYDDLGDYERSLEYNQKALLIAQEIGDLRGESMLLSDIGNVRNQLGHYAEAIPDLEAALRLAEQANLHEVKSFSNAYLAKAHLYCGDLRGAKAAIIQARDADVHHNNHLAASLHGLILLKLAEPEAARAAFEDAIRAADSVINDNPDYCGNYCTRAFAQAGLALLSPPSKTAHLDAAITDYREAVRLSSSPGVIREQRHLLDTLITLPGGERLQAARDALSESST